MSVEQVQGNDEVDAEMSFHECVQEDLLGDQNVQKTLESRDVMDQQGDAQEDQAQVTLPQNWSLTVKIVLWTRKMMSSQQPNQKTT